MSLRDANGFDWSTSIVENFGQGGTATSLQTIAHRYPLHGVGTTNLAVLISNGAGNQPYTIPGGITAPTIYMGWAFRQAISTPFSGAFIFDLYESGVHHLRADVTSDGVPEQVVISRATTPIIATSSNIPFFPGTAGAWHYFEAKVTLHDTVGAVEIRIDGVTLLNATGLDTRNGGGGLGFTDIIFGQGFSDNGNAMMDDFYLISDDGVGLTGFQGDSIIDTLYPSGNGTYSQLLGSDGNSVDNYLLVDDPGATNDADYVASATVGQKDTYVLPDLPASAITPKGIVVRTRAHKTDAGSKSGRRLLRSGGADHAGSDLFLIASPLWYHEVVENDPATGLPWTVAAINALESGFEVRP